MHKNFSHPSTESLMNLLRRSQLTDVNSELRKELEDIAAKCKSCQIFAPKPSIFRVSFPEDKIVFNHEIEVDIMWIDSEAILHILDRGTRYSVAKYLRPQTAENIWNIIIEFWVSVFIGFPNIIAHDQGPQFQSDYFQNSCAQFGIITKETPTESHNSLSLCERYHSIIRRIFYKIRGDFPDLPKEVVLSLAVHSVNSFAGPDGLTPTLLLFGHYPRIPIPNLSSLPTSQKDRFKALEVARKEMMTITAQRRVAQALKHKGPMAPTHPYEFGDKVRVYRETSKKFEGPFIVHSYDNRKTVYVDIGNERRPRIEPFIISSVKPYRTEEEEPQGDVKIKSGRDEQIQTTQQLNIPESDIERVRFLTEIPYEIDSFPGGTEKSPVISDDEPSKIHSIPSSILTCISQKGEEFLKSENAYEVQKYRDSVVLATITVTNPQNKMFDQAKETEVLQLLKKGTYEFVSEESVPNDATVLQSRFVLTIKNVGEKDELLKARLVIMGHVDPDKARVVNEAPTLLKSSMRIIIALGLAHSFEIWCRDVSQAFVQSRDALPRRVYIRAPKNDNVLQRIGAPLNSLLHAIKPLYGLAESSGYWWATFREFHVKKLKMSSSVLDPCLFFKNINMGMMIM